MPAGQGRESSSEVLARFQPISHPAWKPWLVASLLVVVDQLTKLAVRAGFEPGQSIPILPPVLHFTYVQNTGVAFGLFPGYPFALIVLSLVVAGWVGRELALRREAAWIAELGLALILAGAVGNLIDRVVFGYVTDFFDLRVWPVFNIADSCITIGVALFLLERMGIWPRKTVKSEK